MRYEYEENKIHNAREEKRKRRLRRKRRREDEGIHYS